MNSIVATIAAVAALSSNTSSIPPELPWITGQPSPTVSTPVTIHDPLKPGAEILVSAPCSDRDTQALLFTSFGASAIMSPAADMGELIGYVTAPSQISAGPVDGRHTATVVCQSGYSGTVVFPDSGNGDNH